MALAHSVGKKLTKFRGHIEIIENHESFYPRKFLAVRYSPAELLMYGKLRNIALLILKQKLKSNIPDYIFYAAILSETTEREVKTKF